MPGPCFMASCIPEEVCVYQMSYDHNKEWNGYSSGAIIPMTACSYALYIGTCITLPYLTECKTRIFLKADTKICEVILISHMKCQIRSLWTTPSRVKPRPDSQNWLVRSTLFWDIMQPRVEISYLCFRTRVKKSRRQNTIQVKLTDTVFILGGLCPSSNFLKKQGISEAGSGSIFRQKTWATWTESFSITRHHRNVLQYVPEKRSSPRVVTWKWLLKH